MKLWEMLRDGKVGDRFKCISKYDSWNGEIFEFVGTDTGCCIKRVKQNELTRGYLLDMCSAALDPEVDWIKEPKQIVYTEFYEAYKALMNGSKIESVNSGIVYENKDYAISFPSVDIGDRWIIHED